MAGTSPSFLIGGVPCTVYHGDADGSDAIREQIPQEGLQVTARIKCPWTQRTQVYRGLRGSSTISGNQIIRTPPFAYPDYPALFCLSVSDVSGVKMRVNQTTGWPYYQWAIITAHFGFPTFGFSSEDPRAQNDPSGEPWTTTKFKVSGEALNIPGGAFKYGPPSVFAVKPIPSTAATLIQPHCEISMTRHLMPYVPLAEVMAFAGSVNANPVVFSNQSFATGTLLFYSVNTQPGSDPSGFETQEVEYIMVGNVRDWNEVMDPNGVYCKIDSNGDGHGSTPFPYLDFFSQLP